MWWYLHVRSKWNIYYLQNKPASEREAIASHRVAIQAYMHTNHHRMIVGYPSGTNRLDSKSIRIEIGLRASPVQSSPSFLPNDYYYYQWQLWHPIDIGCSQMKGNQMKGNQSQTVAESSWSSYWYWYWYCVCGGRGFKFVCA